MDVKLVRVVGFDLLGLSRLASAVQEVASILLNDESVGERSKQV